MKYISWNSLLFYSDVTLCPIHMMAFIIVFLGMYCSIISPGSHLIKSFVLQFKGTPYITYLFRDNERRVSLETYERNSQILLPEPWKE